MYGYINDYNISMFYRSIIFYNVLNYKSRIYFIFQYNFCCDNCYFYVVMVLNLMNYDNKLNYNMVVLCILMFIYGKYVR